MRGLHRSGSDLVHHRATDRKEVWATYGPYVLAVLVTVLTGLLRFSLDGPLEEKSRFLLFLPGVVLVSWLGGTGPGLLNLLGGVVAGSLVVPPSGERFMARSGDLLSVVLYLASGAACIAIVRSQRETQHQLEVLNQDLEGRVRTRTAQLELALRDIQRFTYAVAHNMRSPLRAILGYSRMVREPGDDLADSRIVGLSKLEGAAKRMSELINDLLAYARLCGCDLNGELVDLSATSREAIAQAILNHGCPESNVQVESGLIAWGDRKLLAEAVARIVDNCVKYRQRDRILSIAVRAGEGRGETVIEISDNGMGFEMAYVHKIFEPFERLHTDDAYPGTGIGLAVAERIIEKHRGRIAAVSTPDIGTTITIALPSPVS